MPFLRALKPGWLLQATHALTVVVLLNVTGASAQVVENGSLRFPEKDASKIEGWIYSVITHFKEECAVYNNGNASCRLKIRSGDGYLECAFLFDYRLTSAAPKISAHSMTAHTFGWFHSQADPDPFSEILSKSTDAARQNSEELAGSILGKKFISSSSPAVLNNQIAENESYVFLKTDNYAESFVAAKLGSDRVLEITLSRRPEADSKSISVRVFLFSDDSALVSNSAKCVDTFAQSGDISFYYKERKRFSKGLTFVTKNLD